MAIFFYAEKNIQTNPPKGGFFLYYGKYILSSIYLDFYKKHNNNVQMKTGEITLRKNYRRKTIK